MPVKVREFRGLRIEIGQRVQNEWRKVPVVEILRLQESVLAAWEKHEQRFVYKPISKVIEESLREEARLRAELKGPHCLNDALIRHRVNNRERIELLAAYEKRNPKVLRKIASRMERKEQTVDKRKRERFHGLDITLVREWLNEDGLCLAWFSIGALEMLLRKAGLWDVGKPPAGIRQRVTRLGLERLRRPIIRTSHVNVDGSPVKID